MSTPKVELTMDIASPAPPGLGTILDVARTQADQQLPAEFRAVVQASGLTATGLVRAFARLSFGPGKVSFADYVKLRLFDPAFHAGARLDAFVGQRHNRDLCVTANHRHDWLGMLSNKIASLSYLGAYGFPTIPVAATYAAHARPGAAGVLTDRAGLDRFLTDATNFPLFGKPVESFQSLGSIALDTSDAAARELVRTDGTRVPLDGFLDEVATRFPAGYLFQPLTVPHPAIVALCGPRLATVRIITAACEDGPRVFRAAWKVPAGANVADNFWRSGNLLAQMDLQTGRVGRVVSGTGLTTVEHTRHPDTQADMPGFAFPHWEAMKALALDGARLMRHVPLIGWDLACTPAGPVIVEMNEAPDFFLVQFADRRGVLDDTFAGFLAYQRRQAAAQGRTAKATIAKL